MSDNDKWPEYLDVAETALVLKVSKMTVYRLIHKGELEAVRVGRGFRIDGKVLRAYLHPVAA